MNNQSTNYYLETADIETASDAYASRFAGPLGDWLLKTQEETVLRSIGTDHSGGILDVGGGHAQLAIPLARAGCKVTVLGSHQDCALRIQPQIDAGEISFATGNLIQLPYPDNSFDAVICFRFISHCNEWRHLVSELCRVARKTVIIDYPTWQSVNIASPLLFKLKRRIEKNTRTYTLFSHRQINAHFRAAGFIVLRRTNQFFLPMALHRAMNRPKSSDALEKGCRAIGLTKLLGSPAILTARIQNPPPAE